MLLIIAIALLAAACEKQADPPKDKPAAAKAEAQARAIASTSSDFADAAMEQNTSRALQFREIAMTKGLSHALREFSASDSAYRSIDMKPGNTALYDGVLRDFFTGAFFVAFANANHPGKQIFVLYNPFFDALAAIQFGITGEVADMALFPSTRLLDPSKAAPPEMEWIQPVATVGWKTLRQRAILVARKASEVYILRPPSPIPISQSGADPEAIAHDQSIVVGRAIGSMHFLGVLVDSKTAQPQLAVAGGVGIFMATGNKDILNDLKISFPKDFESLFLQIPKDKRAQFYVRAGLHDKTGGFVLWYQTPDIPQLAYVVSISGDNPAQLIDIFPIELVEDPRKIPTYPMP